MSYHTAGTGVTLTLVLWSFAVPSLCGQGPDLAPGRDPGASRGEREADTRIDRYGDPLPPGAIARLGTVRLRHPNDVQGVVFSPEGKRMASWGGDGAVRLWDIASGKLLAVLAGHHALVRSVSFSADGRSILSASGDGTVRIHNLSGKSARSIRFAELGRTGKYALSPDGKWLAVADRYGPALFLWDLSTGKRRHKLAGHAQPVDRLGFSGDGTLLATTEPDGSIRLWDVASGEQRSSFEGDTPGLYALTFSPDNKRLAALAKHEVHVWSVPAGKKMLHLNRGETGQVWTFAFGGDARTLILGCTDEALRVWDLDKRRRLRTVPGHRNVVLSPDGKQAATWGKRAFATISLWDLATGKPLHDFRGHRSYISSLAFDPAGKRIASVSPDGTVRVWEAATGKELAHWPLETDNLIEGLNFTPDGRKLVLGDKGGNVCVWDMDTGTRTRRYQGSPAPGYGRCVLSPDGKVVAMGGPLAAVYLSDLQSGKRLATLPGHPSSIESIAFSDDGGLLAVGCGVHRRDNDKSLDFARVVLWDLAAREELGRLPDHEEKVYALAVSPDGRMVASAGFEEPFIRLTEVATLKERLRLAGAKQYLTRLAFSPDGRWLASGGWGQTLRLWDTSTGKQVWHSSRHQGRVNHIAFSPGGRLLVSGGGNPSPLVWEVQALIKDTPAPVAEATDKQLEAWWAALEGEDAAKAYQAIRHLAARPEQALPLLRPHLRRLIARPAPSKEHIARLIAALGSDTFTEREKASAELRELGGDAAPALRRALAKTGSPEVRRRIEEVLRAARGRPIARPSLRILRAIEVLEHLGTEEARRLLRQMAEAWPGSRQGDEAERALGRLEKR
jgi:WD40 repeat protein